MSRLRIDQDELRDGQNEEQTTEALKVRFAKALPSHHQHLRLEQKRETDTKPGNPLEHGHRCERHR